MKSLIINADDFGADEARNKGIFEAIQAGRVTSVSVLANGDGFEDAMNIWKGLGKTDVSLGIHINLSEGRPVNKDLRLLTDQDGLFLGKKAARDLLQNSMNGETRREIQREVIAQIQALQAFGTPITHLDGHQHIHVLPSVLTVILASASENRISWMRIPDEPHPSILSLMVHPDSRDEAAMFSSLGAAARSVIMLSEIESCDHFRGLYLKGKLDITLLDKLFQDLPVGLTELMVHPGRISDTPSRGFFSAFSTLDRERELEALLDPAFPELIKKYEISLIPFPEELP
jgi:predicted glycoside hydrolase/deacetylase ChbG (UPF0249 family)